MSVGLAWRWRRGPEDRGAVGVTFGILLASGVLLGSLAIVVDVGRLYVERGELQNGADSAALALARACSQNEPACFTEAGLRALAQEYANANAEDRTSIVDVVCGEVPGVLPPCGDQPANLTGCVGTPPDEKYVEVHLSTRMRDGDTVLPPAFAQTLAGGNSGTSVGACARAAWGPADLTILAFTISICEFDDATDNGTDFANPGGLRSGDEYVIQFWTNAHRSCDEPWRPAGPAGFLTGGGNCELGVIDGVVSGTVINEFSDFEIARADCVNRVNEAHRTREIIYLPVHDGVTIDGPENRSFRHAWVAPFLVTGYQLGAPVPDPSDPGYDPDRYRERSWLTGRHPCDTIRFRCIAGAFVGAPIPVSALTGDDRIRLVG